MAGISRIANPKQYSLTLHDQYRNLTYNNPYHKYYILVCSTVCSTVCYSGLKYIPLMASLTSDIAWVTVLIETFSVFPSSYKNASGRFSGEQKNAVGICVTALLSWRVFI